MAKQPFRLAMLPLVLRGWNGNTMKLGLHPFRVITGWRLDQLRHLPLNCMARKQTETTAMKVTRSMFHAFRQQDAIETKARNRLRKFPERDRRDARMIVRVKEGSLPYTPDVMSWLSRKLDKPARKITTADIKTLLA